MRIIRIPLFIGFLLVALVGGIAAHLYEFFGHFSLKRAGILAVVALAAIVVVVGINTVIFLQRDEPELQANIEEHFKYGSIGSDAIPYWIWRVLPDLFPEYLPAGPGEGYARLGFIFESNSPIGRPIGASYREKPIPLQGLNRAVCHTGIVRDSSKASPRIVLGMPAHRFDLQNYVRFLSASARDDRFNGDTLLPAIQEVNPDFSWLDGLTYRYFIIPRLKDALIEEGSDFAWLDRQPPLGPGRIDTFVQLKVLFGFEMEADETIATVDLPSLWNQEVREGMWLHWDGNNNSVEERNKSAALAAGGFNEDSLDLQGIKRIEDRISALNPPDYPRGNIDWSRVESGERFYQANCAVCHALDGRDVGQVTQIDDVGTDTERLDAFTQEQADGFNQLGSGRPWAFSHFRKTNGYANMPLDGIWLRAPYLHNGSVSSLRELLKPPDERLKIFYRGYEVYDYEDVGFVSTGPEAEQLGFKLDTGLRGNSNQGHEYRTALRSEEEQDLLEFLKTQ